MIEWLGWAYLSDEIFVTYQDTIGDMINRFLKIGKATSKIIVDGYEITVRKAKEGAK